MIRPRKKLFLRLLPPLLLLALLGVLALLRTKDLLKHLPADSAGSASVVLNEVCAKNLVAMTYCGLPDGDWVELYSTYGTPYSLAGWSISDDAQFLRRFVFPEGTSMDEYLVLLADGTNHVDEGGRIHLPFQLDAGGETLYLCDASGTVVDTLTYPKLNYDESYGRAGIAPNEIGLLPFATPGRSNSVTLLTADTGPTGQISFSVPGGFYEESQTVALTSDDPDAVIVYTTDGSEPTTGSPLYTGPIAISSLTGTPNHYVNQPLSLVLSDLDDTHWLANYAYLNAPDPVDKCTTITARLLKDGHLGKRISAASYWIGVTPHTLPVVSVSTNADELFGSEGIYAAGSTYFTLRKNGVADRAGNFTSSNKIYASLSLYAPDGHEQQTTGKLRLAGQYSQTISMLKNLSFTGTDTLTVSTPEGGDYSADSFVLRGQGALTHFTAIHQDAFFSNYLYGNGLGTRLNIPVVLYLDGEYWGVYTLRESMGADFYREHFGVEPEDMEFYRFADGAPPPASLDALLTHLKEMDSTTPEAYAWAQEHFDLDGFCRYIVNEMYTYNTDDLYSSGNNSALWCDNSATGDGRWHFLLTDLDATLYEVDRDPFVGLLDGDFHRYLAVNLLFQKMWQNEAFRTQFADTMRQEMATTYAPDQLVPAFEAWCDILRPEVPRDLIRYERSATPLAPLAASLTGTPQVSDFYFSLENWESTEAVIQDYFTRRADEMLRYLEQYLAAYS